MKLATYSYRGGESFGAIKEDGLCDIPSLWPDGPASLLAALQAGPEVLRRITDLVSAAKAELTTSDVTLLAPIPAPPKVLALAVNYLEHHREFDRRGDMPENPKLTTTPRPFLMPPTAVIGPNAEIPWPVYSEQIDYEVELAVVIGRPAKNITPRQAPEYIAGYTIANDVSARSLTYARGRSERPKDAFFDWLHGKWADGFCPMGPHLVTAEEIGDPRNLRISLTVNGQVRQDSTTANMIFDVYELVSFCSRLMTLTPGDVIATGTPAGVGLASGRFLAAGDVITCRIEKIGQLTNTLGPRPASFYEPCAQGRRQGI